MRKLLFLVLVVLVPVANCFFAEVVPPPNEEMNPGNIIDKCDKDTCAALYDGCGRCSEEDETECIDDSCPVGLCKTEDGICPCLDCFPTYPYCGSCVNGSCITIKLCEEENVCANSNDLCPCEECQASCVNQGGQDAYSCCGPNLNDVNNILCICCLQPWETCSLDGKMGKASTISVTGNATATSKKNCRCDPDRCNALHNGCGGCSENWALCFDDRCPGHDGICKKNGHCPVIPPGGWSSK